MRSKNFAILFISILLLFSPFASIAKKKKPGKKNKSKKVKPCKSKKVFFKNELLNYEDVNHIVPLGNISPSGHTWPTRFLFFKINREDQADFQSPTISVPFYAPGKFTITKINYNEDLETNVRSYSLDFTVCKELTGVLNHIPEISQGLEDLMNASQQGFCENQEINNTPFRRCEKTISYKTKPGEMLGQAGGPSETELDISLFDSRIKPYDFGNKQRWANDKYGTTVCALDYFTDEIKSDYKAKLGNEDQTRSIEPLCGTVDSTIPTTAQGIWLKEGSDIIIREDQHIALVFDNVNPEQAAFSIGNSLSSSNLASGIYYFGDTDSDLVNRKFSQVTSDGNTYCYEVLPRFAQTGTKATRILLQMLSETKLRLAGDGKGSCGTGPWSFGENFTDFER